MEGLADTKADSDTGSMDNGPMGKRLLRQINGKRAYGHRATTGLRAVSLLWHIKRTTG